MFNYNLAIDLKTENVKSIAKSVSNINYYTSGLVNLNKSVFKLVINSFIIRLYI
jgi:hypothetical protein